MKIRANFVSNSSSSSFIISCENSELADRVVEMYGATYDLMMQANPHYVEDGLDRECFKKLSSTEIIKQLENAWVAEVELKQYKEYLDRREAEGYKFLMATVASDDGTCEYEIVTMFRDYILPALRGKYDWTTNTYEHEVDLSLDKRWS